jgi:hypothetical protein
MSECDVLLIDMTIPNRNYVGCVGELVYASLAGVPAVVVVGDTDYGDRLWLRAHSTLIVREWGEAVAAVESLAALSESDREGRSARWKILATLSPRDAAPPPSPCAS